MRILVTGAGGFVGRRIVSALRELKPEVELLIPARDELNLLDQEDATKYLKCYCPSHVIHCAWVTEHGVYWSSPDNKPWVAATVHLARQFYQAGGERFVGIGTVAEYEWTGAILSEDSPLHPATVYGAAKLESCLKITAVASKRRELGHAASFAWCRLFYLFGEGEDPRRFVASIKQPLLRGEAARCENPDLVRDMMEVGAAGEAIAKVALSDYEGPINICSGRGERLGDIARRIARECGAEDRLSFGTGEAGVAVVGDAARLRALINRLVTTSRGQTGSSY